MIPSVLRRFAGLFGKKADTSRPAPDLAAALAAAGLDREAWLNQVRQGGALFFPDAARIAGLAVRFPDEAGAVVAAAETVLAHRFDLLGSGPFVPADPDRPEENGYRPIDWRLDPVKNLRFPAGVHHKQWDLYAMRPGLADVKLPWELARCQHFAPLCQAFAVTGDIRFAREILDEIDDFTQSNPVGYGIHWTCTMDVAIRAANWAMGLAVIGGAGLASERYFAAYESLFAHGTFIRANLENTYEVTSNHFLSNVVGLHVLGAVFAALPQGRVWDAFTREALERETAVQILPDGADFESSVPYHRLVLELFLTGARLAEHQGRPLSRSYHATLAAMTGFLAGVLRPDGLSPVIGDADDGRVFVLSGYGTRPPQDARHVLAPAALLLDRPEWLAFAGPLAAWEAAMWGLDVSGSAFGKDLPPDTTRLFPDAGIGIVRQGGHYLVVTNAIVGTKGFGNHKHNDQLSFEFHHAGIPVVVDPGSHVYTGDPESRNLFRSTAMHSTLRVDGLEQNDFKPEWLFRMFETAHPDPLIPDQGPGWAGYCGRHRGYARVPGGPVHARVFRLLLDSGALILLDQLKGSGRRRIDVHFHLAPGVAVEESGPGALTLAAGEARLELAFPAEFCFSLTPSQVSPSYGVSLPCLGLDLAVETDIGDNARFTFTLGPQGMDRALAAAHVREMMQTLEEMQ